MPLNDLRSVYRKSCMFFIAEPAFAMKCDLGLAFLSPFSQPQHTPHLWQAAVAAAV